jgi:hypothetical protein
VRTPTAISGREIELTTAAAVLEEQRTATTVENVAAATIAVAPVVPAAPVAGAPSVTAPRATALILGVLLFVQASWIIALGYLAYKLL